MDRFKIDDVAKATGLTKRTIRYYEEIGLIKPPARSEGGTRLYTADDIEQLNNTLFTSYVMETSPYERGVTPGMYNFVRWMGAAIAPVLSGVIGHAVSAKAPFMVAMALALVAFLFLVWHKHEPSATKTV